MPGPRRDTIVKYARFLAVYLFSLATLTGILLGGAWMWLGFVVIYGVMILGDESLGDYYEEPAYGHPRLLNSLLYFALPALFVVGVAMAWMAGSGDLFGFGAWAQANLGLDLFASETIVAAEGLEVRTQHGLGELDDSFVPDPGR